MLAKYAERAIVCGLAAESVNLNTSQDRLEITSWYDEQRKYVPTGPVITTADFRFLIPQTDLYNQSADWWAHLFPVGEGYFSAQSLGPSDVCAYCGTAWLPGVLQCYNCGGETNHFSNAIEYTHNTGYIREKSWQGQFHGVISLSVSVEFTNLKFTNTPLKMFEHSLWRNAPALWVCHFCGYVVLGETSSCPGCSGKRVPIKELATQKRYCIYCNRETWGNYACERCNQRLMAVKEIM